MKIKSITDVITNSSSEVFIAKTDDINRYPKIADTVNERVIYSPESVDVIIDDWNNKRNRHKIEKLLGQFNIGAERCYQILTHFYITPTTKSILHDFGHSDEEIQKYIEEQESKYDEYRKKILTGIIGWSIISMDTNWDGYLPTEMIEWFDTNKIKYSHDKW